MSDPLELDLLLYESDPSELEGHGPYDNEPPKDLGRVDWHLRKSEVLSARIDELGELFNAEIVRLGQRRDEVIGGLERRRQWHDEAVEAWHRREYGARRVEKTVNLPHGSSELRSPPAAFEVVDEDAFKGWAAMVGVEEALWPPKPPVLSKRAAKDLLKPAGGKGEPGARVEAVYEEVDRDTGEVIRDVVPGVEFRQGRDRHNVRGPK